MSSRLRVETLAFFELEMFKPSRFTQALLVFFYGVFFYQALFAEHLSHPFPKLVLDWFLYTAEPKMIRISELEADMYGFAFLQRYCIDGFEYKTEIVSVVGSPDNIIS